jgi:hypothetical protein
VGFVYVRASGKVVVRRILGVGWRRLPRLLTHISPISRGKEGGEDRFG